MLGCPREAHDSRDQRVVTTVNALLDLGKQFIETMRRPLTPTAVAWKSVPSYEAYG
jgi:hypothetical protein